MSVSRDSAPVQYRAVIGFPFLSRPLLTDSSIHYLSAERVKCEVSVTIVIYNSCQPGLICDITEKLQVLSRRALVMFSPCITHSAGVIGQLYVGL